MRLLTPRRVAVTAICAALTLGTAGPALAHSHHPLPQSTGAVDAEARAPQDIGDILSSLTSLLGGVVTTVLGTNSNQAAPAGNLNSAQMTDLTAAIEALKKAAAEAEEEEEDASTPTTTPTTVTGGGSMAGTDADMEEALADMQEAVTELVAATSKKQASADASRIQAAVKNLVDTVMRDVTKMAETPTTGMTTLPAPTTAETPLTGV
ncbi:hypothetical protein QWM81_19175 [Streptomyces ficellus]|uniref:Secreted protein n=1 Tax=Streptomyces ficellus TaxID=1977088 RepID=A0ABT7Z9G9_9ACTN|nr:hypothetical protein [Streptomyces ficellus]MDN3296144.1 hypothetical protein [Streptomyces ficellus]